MQKLKNIATGAEYIITGSIGVPREVEENVFEVWTHFSVDLDGDGQIDTIEVHPESTEWEVIDVPDPLVEPEPTPEPDVEPTAEEIARREALLQANEAKSLFLARLKEWDAQRVAGKFVVAYGGTVPESDATAFQELTTWLLQNMKAEYAVEAKPYLSALM